MQHYFESTREKTNVYVDMALMPKICFYSGMPLIVVDLMIYLCGGYSKNGAPLEDQLRRAFKGIRERAPAKRREK